MGTTITTIIVASCVVFLAIILLGIGALITGKNRIVRGACGMDPEKARDQRCGEGENTCEICRPTPKKKS